MDEVRWLLIGGLWFEALTVQVGWTPDEEGGPPSVRFVDPADGRTVYTDFRHVLAVKR